MQSKPTTPGPETDPPARGQRSTRHVTIEDVAQAAGVHKGTVSRALRQGTESGQVSAKTVRRIRKIAMELGYVPSAIAQGLRSNVTKTVGIVIPDLMNPIYPPIILGIEQVLRRHGYTALLVNTEGGVEDTVIDSLQQHRVDGLLVAAGRLDTQPGLARAYAAGVLAVMVNAESQAAPYPVVTSDSEAGVMAAVEHLTGLGHRHIAHLAGPRIYAASVRRIDTFVACTQRHGVRGDVVQTEALSVDEGERSMRELLRRGEPPTAVLGGNDLIALGVLRALRAAGLRCPEDISVVGFNDMPFAEDAAPSLTTVRVPLHDMGARAAQLLLDAIGVQQQQPATLLLPVSLVVRESTGPARTGSLL